MVNLGMRVFDSYTLQDILGENPPFNKKLQERLEDETARLVQGLGVKSQAELQEILAQHIMAKQELTKFSGAQAMDQAKIEMFHEFLAKYIAAIQARLE